MSFVVIWDLGVSQRRASREWLLETDHAHERIAAGRDMNRHALTGDGLRVLRRCNSNLARTLELASTWRERDATFVAESLLDALLDMLDVDFLYLCLDDAAQTFLRLGRVLGSQVQPDTVRKNLTASLAMEGQQWPSKLSVGGIDIFITPFPLGIVTPIGFLVAGSRRENFPSEPERLHLSIAASQASLAFRELRQPIEPRPPDDPSRNLAAEEALPENERKLNLIINTMPVMAWSTTADGMADFFNRYYLDFVGSSFEDLQELGFLSQFHPDDLPGLLHTWQGMMASKCGGDLEGRVRRADGEYRWVLFKAAPLIDTDGNVIKWYGVNIDIEDRRRTENSLREAEKSLLEAQRNLTLIIDSLPVLVWSSHTDGACDFVNKRYLDYVGLPIEEILDYNYLQVWHPDDLEQMLDIWKSQFELETATNQGRIRRFDGVYRWFYFSGQKFTDVNGNVRWFGVSLDIEDLRRVQDALKESEEALRNNERRLHQIINTIPGLVWSAKIDGECTFINDQYLDYLGMTFDEAKSGWVSKVHPDDVDNLLRSWNGMMESGRGGDVEARLRRFDGQYRWFLFRTNPLFDDTGILSQWFGVNTDIEDRKRAEEDLRESQAELAHITRMTTLGELAVSIAHELNQPLMAIVTNAGACLRWLNEGQLDVAEARQAVESIAKQGHRTGEIIASMRALARKSPLEMERLELEPVIREVLDLIRGEIARRGIDLATRFPAEAIHIFGDRTQLQQVVLNLIMNGAEAMTDSSHDRRKLVVRTSANKGEFVEVSVSDSGIGLGPNDVERIFDAFFTTKLSGIGMGLSICRSIVEAHGGKIWASTKPAGGSVFHFTVRRAGEVHGTEQ